MSRHHIKPTPPPLRLVQDLLFPSQHQSSCVGGSSGFLRHTEAVVFLSTLKPYGRIYSAITHPNKKWQFTPIFRNEGSCFLLKYRSEWKNGGNYYVIKSLDAGKDDYEPCIEKMKECSGKNVTYVNEGENCGKAEEGC
ncbi:hypothetical protein MRX96_024754 [Rhipicephalus microplus]